MNNHKIGADIVEMELDPLAYVKESSRQVLSKIDLDEHFPDFPPRLFSGYENPRDAVAALNSWLDSLDQESPSNISDQDLSRENLYKDDL